MKKVLSVFLAVLMTFGCISVVAFASDADSVTIKMLNYNVAGLPDVNYILGKGGRNTVEYQKALGPVLNESGYDIIAAQEDFSYHKDLTSSMTAYTYKTKSSGGIPGGDGLAVFSKYPVYNTKHTKWSVSGGPIKDGDVLAPKGILYNVIDLGNGIYLDLYDIHADAFDNEDSANARAKQYKQLIDLVEKQSADRPVIITGDFNTTLSIMNSQYNSDEIAMLEQFIVRAGMKDAWRELYLGGDYENFNHSDYHWGKSDSVEKFMYRDGGGVSITIDELSYVDFYKEEGVNFSDHSGLSGTITFTKTADFTEDTRNHKLTDISDFEVFKNLIVWLFKDLVYVFSHFDELKEALG